MPYEFKMTRMVEFADTDMAGIMHFSNYFRFMEATEHAFFRSLDLSVHSPPAAAGGDRQAMQGWARVHAACRYAAPLRYQDTVEVHLVVREKKPRAISYDFVFRNTTDPARPAAVGEVTAVYVERSGDAGAMRSADMPADVTERVQVAPADLLDTLESAGGSPS